MAIYHGDRIAKKIRHGKEIPAFDGAGAAAATADDRDEFNDNLKWTLSESNASYAVEQRVQQYPNLVGGEVDAEAAQSGMLRSASSDPSDDGRTITPDGRTITPDANRESSYSRSDSGQSGGSGGKRTPSVASSRRVISEDDKRASKRFVAEAKRLQDSYNRETLDKTDPWLQPPEGCMQQCVELPSCVIFSGHRVVTRSPARLLSRTQTKSPGSLLFVFLVS